MPHAMPLFTTRDAAQSRQPGANKVEGLKHEPNFREETWRIPLISLLCFLFHSLTVSSFHQSSQPHPTVHPTAHMSMEPFSSRWFHLGTPKKIPKKPGRRAGARSCACRKWTLHGARREPSRSRRASDVGRWRGGRL